MSPDGRLIASGDRDRTLCIWDGKTLERIRTLHTDGYAEEVSFSPDGRLLACSGREASEANVWTTETWEPVAKLSIRTNAALAFSPDSKYIAAGGYQQEPLCVWDVDTAQLVREWPDAKRMRPMNIVWSPDSRIIVTARSDGTVILLDVSSGQVTRSFEGHEADITRVAFSPDGKFLASTSGDGTLRLWLADSGEPFRVLGAAGRRFFPVTFSPDGARVAAADVSALRVWDVANGVAEAVRLGHSDNINSLTFTPDGRRILTTSHDRTVKIWDGAPAERAASPRGIRRRAYVGCRVARRRTGRCR